MKISSYQIRLLRQARNMKQEQVAALLCISYQRYSQLENSKNLSSNRIEEIIKALGYTLQTALDFLNAIPHPSGERIPLGKI